MAKDIKLKVAEAVLDDVNKGIVRIDTSFMNQIGVRPGDIVDIEGERKTVSIADRAYPGDIGLNIIRMDGSIRRNAKTGLGEMINVTKADVKEAKRVVIAPARKGIIVRASAELFKQGLLGRAVVKGDIVSLGGTTTRRTTLSHSPFEDIFRMIDEDVMGFGFGDLKFIVVDTLPKQPVIISDLTEVIFNPEAVAVTEEKVIDITYEDIGGLKEEIQKVREMVELPLKHPELFEKLGIEPPKGVLLHGPPGTGKTLLAKAVASESNSHFILINGPEIMSKYYGQSLPPDEKILILEDGMFKREPIGRVVDGDRKNIKVVCFDNDGKLSINKVTGLIKHPLKSKILKVKTASGREIRVTDYHSLFTLGQNGIESVKTSELEPGKSFVAVPKRLPFNPNPIYKLNLFEALKHNDYGLRVRNVQHLVKRAMKNLGLKNSAEILGLRKKYLYDVINKNIGIRVSRFLNLMREADITVEPEFAQVYTKGKGMPAQLAFSEDLWTFLGLWMAEGSYTEHGVRLSIHRREEKAVADLCARLFGNVTVYRKPRGEGSDVLVCSKILQKIMREVLKFESGARNKHVPEIVYNIPENHLAAFLRGYVSGDGSLNTSTPAPMVEVSTESPELADDIAYLLLRFGIVAKIYSRKNRPQKRVCFADVSNLDAFREIGFLDSDLNLIIYNYVQKIRVGRRDRVPAAHLGEILKRQELHGWKGSLSIGREILLRAADPKLKKILAYDVYWDKVVKVEECDSTYDFVYDISVEPCQNFISGFGGIFAHNSEQNLRRKFEEAEKNAPAIIFIDEIDAIASKREEVHGEVEKRVVAQLLALMDGLKSRGKVVVIAASNVPNMLDPALRRPGRFDREIEIGVPSKEGRLDILKIHSRNMPLAKSVNLKELADRTHGFVGADLSALTKEAAMIVLRTVLPEVMMKKDEPISNEILEKLKITRKDFYEALKVVRPSALREVLIEMPNVSWGDIGGMDEVKQQLKEAVEWPIKNPGAFKRLGIRPPRGILLYGAPGTGKTMLAKAVAKESESNFILVKGPELLSKWVGESEKAVREIFKKARQTSPTIIFFDEVDSLAPRRGMSADSNVSERVVNQLLTEMDGLEEMHDVVIIAATNRPDMIDPALLRPGRFDRLIMTTVPEKQARLEIFKVHTKGMPLKNVSLEQLAELTDGYVGADIEAVCREAAILALRKNMEANEVTMKHFTDVVKEVVGPSVTKEIQKSYEDVGRGLRQARAKQLEEERPAYLG